MYLLYTVYMLYAIYTQIYVNGKYLRQGKTKGCRKGLTLHMGKSKLNQ